MNDRRSYLMIGIVSVGLAFMAYSTVTRNDRTAQALEEATGRFKRLMNDPSLKNDGSSLIGDEFIDFELPGLEGGFQRLGSSRFLLKVIIIFSTEDCRLCFGERPLWQKLFDSYPTDRVSIIGICTSKDRGAALSFVKNMNIRFPICWDPLNTVRKGMGFRVSPLRVLLNETNRIIDIGETQTGVEFQQSFLRVIDARLEGKI